MATLSVRRGFATALFGWLTQLGYHTECTLDQRGLHLYLLQEWLVVRLSLPGRLDRGDVASFACTAPQHFMLVNDDVKHALAATSSSTGMLRWTIGADGRHHFDDGPSLMLHDGEQPQLELAPLFVDMPLLLDVTLGVDSLVQLLDADKLDLHAPFLAMEVASTPRTGGHAAPLPPAGGHAAPLPPAAALLCSSLDEAAAEPPPAAPQNKPSEARAPAQLQWTKGAKPPSARAKKAAGGKSSAGGGAAACPKIQPTLFGVGKRRADDVAMHVELLVDGKRVASGLGLGEQAQSAPRRLPDGVLQVNVASALAGCTVGHAVLLAALQASRLFNCVRLRMTSDAGAPLWLQLLHHGTVVADVYLRRGPARRPL